MNHLRGDFSALPKLTMSVPSKLSNFDGVNLTREKARHHPVIVELRSCWGSTILG